MDREKFFRWKVGAMDWYRRSEGMKGCHGLSNRQRGCFGWGKGNTIVGHSKPKK